MAQGPDDPYVIWWTGTRNPGWIVSLAGSKVRPHGAEPLQDSGELSPTHNRHYHCRFSFNHRTISWPFISHFLRERSRYRTQPVSLKSGQRWF